MKRIAIFAVIFTLFFISASFAETAIKAEVDKNKITTDETLTYKIVITSSENKLPGPEVPKFEGFSIISQAQSSTISFVTGKIKTILVYAFILGPTDKGKFIIPPAIIKVNNETYSSDSFEIEVTMGKTLPKPKLQESPVFPKEGQPPSKEPQITL